MSVEGPVQWPDGLADALRAPAVASAAIERGTHHYTSLQLVNALLLSRMVKNPSDLAEVAVRAFDVVFPALGNHVRDLFQKTGNLGVPSCSTRSRARVLLDATIVLLQNSGDTLKIRYGIAESSPQKGHDWLLSAADEVKASDVVACFRSLALLVGIARGRVASAGEDAIRDEVAELRTSLWRSGKRATNLTHKVAALMYAWCCGRRRDDLQTQLLEYLSSYASFCADMGVELRIAEYVVGDLWSLLPEWFQVESIGVDVAPAEAECDFDIAPPWAGRRGANAFRGSC